MWKVQAAIDKSAVSFQGQDLLLEDAPAPTFFLAL